MFRVSNNGFKITETNDTHDLYDIFLGITGDEKVSKEAWVSASNMGFGEKKEIGGYLIEQFDETKEGEEDYQNLRECPFCGNSATLETLNVLGVKWFYVRCEKCRAEINNSVPNEKEAVEAWNRRAKMDGE